MKPIVFVKYFDKGSTVLGGHQMSDALTARGLESRTVYADEIKEIRDSILVFIKKADLRHLVRSRWQGNTTVLDVQDTLCHKRFLKFKPLYDGLIFRSQKPYDDFGSGNGRSTRIYLQWNAAYTRHQAPDDELRLVYLGDPRSFSYWHRLPEVPCVDQVGFFEEAKKYNCHISIRTDPRHVLYKPTCKVSTAAACSANLITTRDAGSLEVLGPDYPFYTDPDPAGIRRTIAYASKTLGGPVWEAALAKLREVRETHDLKRITSQYIAYLTRLVDAA